MGFQEHELMVHFYLRYFLYLDEFCSVGNFERDVDFGTGRLGTGR